MTIKRFVFACATLLTLAATPVWADFDDRDRDRDDRRWHHYVAATPVWADFDDRDRDRDDRHWHHYVQASAPVAPEIDVKSGANAIALLVGALLLAGDRLRARRS